MSVAPKPASSAPKDSSRPMRASIPLASALRTVKRHRSRTATPLAAPDALTLTPYRGSAAFSPIRSCAVAPTEANAKRVVPSAAFAMPPGATPQFAYAATPPFALSSAAAGSAAAVVRPLPFPARRRSLRAAHPPCRAAVRLSAPDLRSPYTATIDNVRSFVLCASLSRVLDRSTGGGGSSRRCDFASAR